MGTVHNWQLGRPMQYPHEEHHPQRQFAFVFNINRCISCHTCSMACKSTWTFAKGQEVMWWNNVETKPYGGYPRHWDIKLLESLNKVAPEKRHWSGKLNGDPLKPYGTFEGQTIFEAARKNIGLTKARRVLGYLPTDEEWRTPNLYEDAAVGEKGQPLKFTRKVEDLPTHSTWFFYLARVCNHCTYPACLAACPRNAIYKRPEDGIVKGYTETIVIWEDEDEVPTRGLAVGWTPNKDHPTHVRLAILEGDETVEREVDLSEAAYVGNTVVGVEIDDEFEAICGEYVEGEKDTGVTLTILQKGQWVQRKIPAEQIEFVNLPM